jgi:hypothetical protein
MFYSLVLSTMQKLVLISIVFLSFIGSAFALDTDPIAQTKLLLDQYSVRVKTLENENAILREEMRKAGIQIPLSLFSGAIQTTVSTGSTVTPGTTTGTTVSTGVIATTSGEVSYSAIEKTYGATYAGFIKRIISEWSKVRDAYAMPKNAYIG